MFFAFLVLLVLLFLFRKPIMAWLKSPSNPFEADVLEAESAVQKSAVFGKREVPPAASVNDPGTTTTTTKD